MMNELLKLKDYNMDVLITHVYDKCRFKHYLQLKFGVKQIALKTINRINEGAVLKLTDLPECDVRYLQKAGYHCNWENPGICKLKIVNKPINTKTMKVCITKVKLYLRLVKYLVTSRVSSDIANAKSKIDNIGKEPLIVYVSEEDLNELNDLCVYEILDEKNETKTIPSYLDNERKSCIDVSPQPCDEPKQEPLNSFHVKFTKVVHYDEMLNERQIQALLKDNHVKSINIEK